MAKIRVNLGDLENALFRSQLLSYSEDKNAFEVDIEVIEGNDPGSGNMVDTLLVTLDKQEKTYDNRVENVRHIVEIFPANRPELENRITTQKSLSIKRAKLKRASEEDEDDIPF